MTEESPFSIEVVEPKVPLVRGGSMSLRVVAKRKPGFTAPIAISLPWNPPGVEFLGRASSIPEKADEASIPMNADGGAALQTWRIVVNGTAGTAERAGHGLVAAGQARRSPRRSCPWPTSRRASSKGRRPTSSSRVNKAVDFPGEAKVTLIGLPNKVTTDVKKITKDTKEIVFRVKTDKVSPAGNHQNLFCQVVVTQEGEPIVHNLGSGQIRIDVPLPPKPKPAAPRPGRRRRRRRLPSPPSPPRPPRSGSPGSKSSASKPRNGPRPPPAKPRPAKETDTETRPESHPPARPTPPSRGRPRG